MDPDKLIAQIKAKFQEAADILGLDYDTATPEEQDLIIEMSAVKQHHLEWFLAIGAWDIRTSRRI